MNALEKKFLSCLQDFVHGNSSPPCSEDIHPKDLYSLSESHSLEEILYHQCRKWLGSENGKAGSDFRKAFLTSVFLSANRKDMLQEIASSFHQKNYGRI